MGFYRGHDRVGAAAAELAGCLCKAVVLMDGYQKEGGREKGAQFGDLRSCMLEHETSQLGLCYTSCKRLPLHILSLAASLISLPPRSSR